MTEGALLGGPAPSVVLRVHVQADTQPREIHRERAGDQVPVCADAGCAPAAVLARLQARRKHDGEELTPSTASTPGSASTALKSATTARSWPPPQCSAPPRQRQEAGRRRARFERHHGERGERGRRHRGKPRPTTQSYSRGAGECRARRALPAVEVERGSRGAAPRCSWLGDTRVIKRRAQSPQQCGALRISCREHLCRKVGVEASLAELSGNAAVGNQNIYEW